MVCHEHSSKPSLVASSEAVYMPLQFELTWRLGYCIGCQPNASDVFNFEHDLASQTGEDKVTVGIQFCLYVLNSEWFCNAMTYLDFEVV